MSLRPIFDKAAHALRIPLFGIDMGSQSVLMDKLGIDEVPTLLIYRNGKAPIVYGGVQNAKAIVDSLMTSTVRGTFFLFPST